MALDWATHVFKAAVYKQTANTKYSGNGQFGIHVGPGIGGDYGGNYPEYQSVVI